MKGESISRKTMSGVFIIYWKCQFHLNRTKETFYSHHCYYLTLILKNLISLNQKPRSLSSTSTGLQIGFATTKNKN